MGKILSLLLVLCSSLLAQEKLDLIISSEEISSKIESVAQKIDADYAGEELVIVMVMKGAVMVTSDLMRHLHVPCSLEYLRASSYGQGGTKRGELKIYGLEGLDLRGKNLLIVDDIFDSGNTMTTLVKKLKGYEPKSIKTLVLLLKKVKRDITYIPDYVLFEVQDRFLIGYGLDYKEYYRGLDGIYAFPNDLPPEGL